MSEHVRLRHQQAEELTTKAKAQAEARLKQQQRLMAKGQIMPPEASLLGCWQTIEKTMVINNSANIVNTDIGDERTYIMTVTPDNLLFGEAIPVVVRYYQDIIKESRGQVRLRLM